MTSTAPPLLQLAAGRKVRPRKAAMLRPKESRLHADVAALLSAHCLPDWKWRWVPAKAQNAREGAIWKRLGAKPHWPDFELVSPYGSVRFLEIKQEGNDLDDGQKEFRIWCVQHGVPHVVAWKMNDVLVAFYEWGCTRLSRSDNGL
jgi:hypothetical protein